MARWYRVAGFTLVEVMVTVGILLILAATAFPAITGLAKMRDDITCSSNLRQIGMGILAYANDNDGRLPGPLLTAQYPYYTSSNQLSYVLLDYLSVDKTLTKVGKKDVFVCPAFRRVVKKLGSTPVYQLNITVTMDGTSELRQPFGYPNSGYPETFGKDEDESPMRLVDLMRITDTNGQPARTTTWMLKDHDKQPPHQQANLSSFSSSPTKMVHRRHRNALFFDFHVEKTDQAYADK